MKQWCEQVIKTYWAGTDEWRRKYWRNALRGTRHEFFRSWLVFAGAGNDKDTNALVHVPSGVWDAFVVSYEELRDLIANNPDADRDFLSEMLDNPDNQKIWEAWLAFHKGLAN